jgi:IS5 family transposase
MERQTTFTDMEYANRRKKTRRENFLEAMDKIIPWGGLCALIEPHYFHNKTGRPARGIETMLRMYFLQIWFSLSDELTEESIFDSHAMRDFMGINFLDSQAPDATTLMKFRHMLEREGLQQEIQAKILALLEGNGLIMHGGTISDATIMQAPSSTRNSTKERDPEMKSTKKGQTYHFGMKAHTGVDAGSGAVVNTAYTAANEHDIAQAVNCYREDDDVRYGDAGFLGVEKRREMELSDLFNRSKRTNEMVDYRISKRPKSRTEKHDYPLNWEKTIEAQKSARRWMVEYPYYIVKRIFGCNRAIYRGIEKNGCRFDMAFASANLYMFRHRLLRISA